MEATRAILGWFEPILFANGEAIRAKNGAARCPAFTEARPRPNISAQVVARDGDDPGEKEDRRAAKARRSVDLA